MDMIMPEVYKPKDILVLRREGTDLLLVINKGEHAVTHRMTIKNFSAEDSEELNTKLSPDEMTILYREDSRLLVALNKGGLLKVFWLSFERRGEGGAQTPEGQA
jgi:hypothetical protein